MFPPIMTFHFDLISGLFLDFWSPNGLFLGLGGGSKLFWGLLKKAKTTQKLSQNHMSELEET